MICLEELRLRPPASIPQPIPPQRPLPIQHRPGRARHRDIVPAHRKQRPEPLIEIPRRPPLKRDRRAVVEALQVERDVPRDLEVRKDDVGARRLGREDVEVALWSREYAACVVGSCVHCVWDVLDGACQRVAGAEEGCDGSGMHGVFFTSTADSEELGRGIPRGETYSSYLTDLYLICVVFCVVSIHCGDLLYSDRQAHVPAGGLQKCWVNSYRLHISQRNRGLSTLTQIE